MMDFSRENPIKRRNALAIMTLGTLLVTVAIAWMLSVTINPLKEGESWFLITSGDNVLGWQTIASKSTDGGTEGYDIIGMKARNVLDVYQSKWQINANLTKGKYISANIRILPDGRGGDLPGTIIQFESPTVSVVRQGAAGKVVREFIATEDYIPEGRLNALILQCAKSGESVFGQAVIDEMVDIVEISLDIVPDAPADDQAPGAVVVQKAMTGSDWVSWYYIVDGQIMCIRSFSSASPNSGFQMARRVDPETVMSYFPTAIRLRETLIR